MEIITQIMAGIALMFFFVFFGISAIKQYDRKIGWPICSVLVIIGIFLGYQYFEANLFTSEDEIEIKYDLSQMKNNELTINTSTGQQVKIVHLNDGRYQIYLPHKIVKIELFYTSYDLSQKRWTWKEGKHVDFIKIDNYIQSNHVLNEYVDGGKGRHIIIYRYKEPFSTLYKNPRKLLHNLLSN